MLTADLLPGCPLVESPFFEEDAADALTPYQMWVARDLHEKGYAVIDFPDPDILEKMDGIRRDLAKQFDFDRWRTGNFGSLRATDAWKTDPRVRSIAANPDLLELLSAIYGRRAIPFQTLNFPVGTQQSAHSDHIHFSSIPERFMCGVWLAFEDIDDDNGPLFYYPGSHKWPCYQNEHIGVPYTKITKGYPESAKFTPLWEALARKHGIERETFKAKKGQALIWSSNIVHGGSAQKDLNRTRWSQVTHYFFENCGYTTPMENDVYQRRVHLRQIVDVSTGKPVPNIISGQPPRSLTWKSLARSAYRRVEARLLKQ
jgi:hypothetical protein